MEVKERLELYKKALIDWTAKHRNTNVGFCFYFNSLGLYVYCNHFFESELPELFRQRTVKYKKMKIDRHYNGLGSTELGRLERIVALKNAIKEVKLLIEKEDEQPVK